MKTGKYKSTVIIIGLALLVSHPLILFLIYLKVYFNNFITAFETNVFGGIMAEFVFVTIILLLGLYSALEITKLLRVRGKLNI